jgi:transcriptional regulator with XRE-family HTH domain
LNFGQRLKELQQQLNIRQQEMADQLCISQSCYGCFEKGKSLVAALFICPMHLFFG